MKIHAIQTGTVAITTAWREGVGHGRRRLLHTVLDRSWTEPLPIYAFAIEHPEGVIVVDTGESAGASLPGYFPRWHPVFRFAVREWVEPEQEIGPQLERLGIRPSDVRRVVMTHLHTDHASGLHHFPDTEILAARAEIAYARAASALQRRSDPAGRGGPRRVDTVEPGSAATPLAERDRASAAGGRQRPRIPGAGVRIPVAALRKALREALLRPLARPVRGDALLWWIVEQVAEHVLVVLVPDALDYPHPSEHGFWDGIGDSAESEARPSHTAPGP